MDVLNILGSYCFPIVACIGMAIYIKDINKQHREDVKELNKEHKEEIVEFKNEIKEALNNNTLAITKLCDKIEMEGRK